MKRAVVTLSEEGLRLAETLAAKLPVESLHVHEIVESPHGGERFSSIVELTRELFPVYDGLIYIAPCGVVVRALAPLVRHKKSDPAVVVTDICGRSVISLLSGHEGGANALAIDVANVIDAEPVITTTTEARKRLIVGVGCKRGTSAQAIVSAIQSALDEAGVALADVRTIASADVKSDEAGLLAAANELGVDVRFISSDEIRNSAREFEHSDFVNERVGVPAVAEPAALLAGRRTRFILRKRRKNGVTVAIAKESCSWLE